MPVFMQKAGLRVSVAFVHAGDPHIKVASGAISVIRKLLAVLPMFWSGHRLLRLVPALLMRTVDTRCACSLRQHG